MYNFFVDNTNKKDDRYFISGIRILNQQYRYDWYSGT